MSDKVWRAETVPPSTAGTMDWLASQACVSPFYLAGGTGLALRFGHRTSRDLDFFSHSFDEDQLLGQLQHAAYLEVVSKSRETLHLHINGTKVSFLGYPYPLLFPFEHFRGLAVADPRDIACMKISAIAGRGARRDFVDLYVAAMEYGLGELLSLFDRKFARVRYSRLHLLKSLVYFEDAEKDPMPAMLREVSWEEITRYLASEVKKLP